MTFRSVLFDMVAPADAEGDFILRRGKYFELGDYPDKEFSLNEAEADAALDGFSGVPINLEHTPTVLDGKLGMVTRIWRQGQDILAEYAIPAWLQRITGGEPIRVSSEWNRATKRPIGAALVLSPRIQDAVIMVFSQQEGPGRFQSEALGKESRKLSLLGRFTAFLRGEGLLDEEGNDVPEPAALRNTEAPPNPSSSLQFSASAEFRQMSEMLKEQAAVISSLQSQFAEEQNKATYVSHTASIMDLVRQGKLTAAEGEKWREVASTHPTAFTAILETLAARPKLPQFSDGPTRRISPDPEEPAARLIALSNERTARTGERYDTAFSKVCRENPELAAAHAASAPAYGGSAHE